VTNDQFSLKIEEKHALAVTSDIMPKTKDTVGPAAASLIIVCYENVADNESQQIVLITKTHTMKTTQLISSHRVVSKIKRRSNWSIT